MDSSTNPTQAEVEQDFSDSLDALTNSKVVRLNKSLTSADRRGIMCLTSMFNFGKYKNKKELGEVIEKDPSYIEWCMDKKVMHISRQAREYFSQLHGYELPQTNDEEGL